MSNEFFSESSQDNRIFIVAFPQMIKEEDIPLLEKAIKSWYLRTEDLFVFDFKNCLDIHKEGFRQLLLFIKTIKSKEKKLISVNSSKGFERRLREMGLNDAFNLNKNISIKGTNS